MKINSNVIITFNEEEIKALVIKKVEAEGYEAGDIKLNIKKKQWSEGHGFGEIDYEKLILQNIEVTARKKQ